MPRFLVTAKQFVEEIGEVEIEAEDVEDAMQSVGDQDDWDWQDGDEIREFEVTGAKQIHDDDDDEQDPPEDGPEPEDMRE